MAADKKLRVWGVKTGYDDYKLLKQLLGRGTAQGRFVPSFNEDDYNTCLLLIGPNGYTIYKMLCLKHGLTELGKSCADT